MFKVSESRPLEYRHEYEFGWRAAAMPAKAFWNAIDELRDKFRSGGATHQARIDYLIESVRAAPPPVQRKMLTVLSDVADGIEDLQCLLLAILPPEVTDRTQADENDDAA